MKYRNPKATIDLKGRTPEWVPKEIGMNSKHKEILVRRQLAVVKGMRNVLVVRVVCSGSSSTTRPREPTYKKEIIANDIFGEAIGVNDQVNLHSQFLNWTSNQPLIVHQVLP